MTSEGNLAPFHKDLRNVDLHPAGYMSDDDPGAVGQDIVWYDTSVLPVVHRIRNETNTGWNEVRGNVGPPGPTGADGLSAYELAIADGFIGDLQIWLASLRGTGLSAYELATLQGGFVGTLEQWLDSLQGEPGPSGPPGTGGGDGGGDASYVSLYKFGAV